MPTYENVELGARVCSVVKKALYDNCTWNECHELVAKELVQLKKDARAKNVGKDETEILKVLCFYDIDDVRDVLRET